MLEARVLPGTPGVARWQNERKGSRRKLHAFSKLGARVSTSAALSNNPRGAEALSRAESSRLGQRKKSRAVCPSPMR